MTAYSSIQASKRIDLLDILRGLALLGVLITNIVEYSSEYSLEDAPTGLSEWTTGLVKVLTEGSFYPLYSILFGIGFVVWMDKSMKRNGSIWLFAWRSCILFFFGYVLIVLLDGNGIFLRYSLLSIPLLLFYKASPKILLAGAIIFLLLGVLHQPISRQLQSMRSPEVQTSKMNQIKKSVQAYQLALSEAKKSKKFSDYAKARSILFSNQLKMIYTLWDKSLPVIFSMFLLGMYCWRKGFFTSVNKHLSFWRKVFWLSLIIGIGGQLVIFTSRLMETKGIFIPNQDILKYSEIILNPVLTFFYISLIVLIAYNLQSKPNTVLNGFKAAGRMSLTNFFLQYVIIAILMYPYGLGFNGLLFSYDLILLAFAIFFLQVLLSVFWFKYFSYGPIEWVWRSLTYMKFQRIKK
jgi:uncharacterized protein